jgi:diguanylate cyclase (GGDEF)-like protein
MIKLIPKPTLVKSDYPDFLIKTAFGCSLIANLIVIPFTINNFVQDRYIMGLATSLVAAACTVNVWYGLRGMYSLFLNTYLLTTAGTFTITYVMIKFGSTGSYWPFLLIPAYYFLLPERRAWIVNLLNVLIIIPIAWSVMEFPLASRFSAVLVGVSLFAFTSMREINILHGKLKEQAVKDVLTGLFNRSLLKSSLQQAIAQSKRSGLPMSLIMFDIDNFKSINDSLGHAMGDKVLISLGDILKKRIRGSDMVFRIGGEEFLVLIHNTNEIQGKNLAEDIRHEVELMNVLPNQRVTISVGISGLKEGMDTNTWMKTCDERLYRAKDEGRNRVVL